MANLTFATAGQAEALAAQEAVRKKALETRQEFEAGAKATGSWDAALTKLKGQGESALRSIQSEQEKIIDQIAKIEKAQAEGLIPPEEAEQGIQRLRQKWVDVDAATVKAKDQTRQYELQQQQLKNAAEDALGSVQTEYEEIQEKIKAVEEAAEEGLIPPEEAERGIVRLKEQLASLEGPIREAGNKFDSLAAKINSSFDPTNFKNVKALAGLLGVPLGIAGGLSLVKATLEEMDKRAAAQREFAVKEKSEEIDLARTGLQQGLSEDSIRQAISEAVQIAMANAIPAEYVRGAIESAIGAGYSSSEAIAATRRVSPLYFNDPKQLAAAVRDYLDPEKGPQYTPSQEELFRVTGGLDPVARQSRIRQIREQYDRSQSGQTAGGLTGEEAEAITQLIKASGLNATRKLILDAFRAGDSPEATYDQLQRYIAAIESAQQGKGSYTFPSPSLAELPRGSKEAQEMLQWLRMIAESMQSVDRKVTDDGGGIGQ